jgi:hypothetical protein
LFPSRSTNVRKQVKHEGATSSAAINQEAQKDSADRASILSAPRRQLARGDKALIGNTG